MSKRHSSRARGFARHYRVDDGRGFRLKRFPTDEARGVSSKKHAEALLADGVQRLAHQQEKLYAQQRWALLVVLQGMDASGKDGTIKHVMSGVNPQGVEVHSFKQPSVEELEHDFLWRMARRLPPRGRIGIFNRSHYEDALIVRVHPEILHASRLPPSLVTKRIWEERFEDIAAFERHLARNGTVILKFFLHISKAEQKKRLLERLEMPEKNWKLSLADVKERELWDRYQDAYEDAIRNTATDAAPWYVVPADKKWFARIVVVDAVVEALDALGLAFPAVDAEKRRELRVVRRELLGQDGD